MAAAPAFLAAAAAVVSPAVPSTDMAASSTTPAVVATAFAVAAATFAATVGSCEPAAAAARAASPSASPLASWAESLSANWPSSLLPTSVITPRPNCAGRPVMFRSVTTSTRVVSPSAASVAVMIAAAVPLPRWSLPRASMTARCAASSFSTNDALPW